MKASRIVITVAVLLGIWWVAWTLTHREKTFGDEAQKEIQAQVSEIQQCKANLAIIHKAWADFKAKHKGADPTVVDLIKNLKDPSVLVCPTAKRWEGLGKPLQAGSVEVDRKKYMPTYGFMWTTAQGPISFKKLGDKAVLCKCTAHAEGLYRAGYKHGMKPDAFSEENKAKLISDVANAKMMVVLRNGTIEERTPED